MYGSGPVAPFDPYPMRHAPRFRSISPDPLPRSIRSQEEKQDERFRISCVIFLPRNIQVPLYTAAELFMVRPETLQQQLFAAQGMFTQQLECRFFWLVLVFPDASPRLRSMHSCEARALIFSWTCFVLLFHSTLVTILIECHAT